jgi:hypothetical protein
MIQTIGILKTSEGVTFENPLININLISASKFNPVKAELFIGQIKENIEPDDTTIQYFYSTYELITFNYNTPNTDFLYIQNLVVDDLQLLFKDCTFEQI